MSLELSFTEKPGYLHAVVTGPNTRENVAAYLEAVMRECVTRKVRRVLVEERLDGPRLNATDIFQIASKGSAKAQGVFERFAYVDVNAQGALVKFAETVAVNRSLPVKVFATVAEAEAWLGFGVTRA